MFIKLQILGSAPGKTVVGQHHAAIFVEVNKKNILLDCGDGTSGQLLKNNLSKDALDHIIISHMHPDHIAGLYLVLQLLYLENRKKPLTIFLPERSEDFKKSMEMFYLFPERFTFSLEILPIDHLHKELDFIEIMENEHLRSYAETVNNKQRKNEMKCYSIIIREKSKKILYTSDIVKIDVQKYRDVDLIIIDAFHPEYSEILRLQKETRARIILNHMILSEIKMKKLNNELEIADEEKIILL